MKIKHAILDTLAENRLYEGLDTLIMTLEAVQFKHTLTPIQVKAAQQYIPRLIRLNEKQKRKKNQLSKLIISSNQINDHISALLDKSLHVEDNMIPEEVEAFNALKSKAEQQKIVLNQYESAIQKLDEEISKMKVWLNHHSLNLPTHEEIGDMSSVLAGRLGEIMSLADSFILEMRNNSMNCKGKRLDNYFNECSKIILEFDAVEKALLDFHNNHKEDLQPYVNYFANVIFVNIASGFDLYNIDKIRSSFKSYASNKKMLIDNLNELDENYKSKPDQVSVNKSILINNKAKQDSSLSFQKIKWNTDASALYDIFGQLLNASLPSGNTIISREKHTIKHLAAMIYHYFQFEKATPSLNDIERQLQLMSSKSGSGAKRNKITITIESTSHSE